MVENSVMGFTLEPKLIDSWKVTVAEFDSSQGINGRTLPVKRKKKTARNRESVLAEAELVITHSQVKSDKPRINAFEKMMNAEQPASGPNNKINLKPATRNKGVIKGSQQLMIKNKWGFVTLKILTGSYKSRMDPSVGD